MPFTVTCDECKQTFSLSDEVLNDPDSEGFDNLLEALIQHNEDEHDSDDDEDTDNDEDSE